MPASLLCAFVFFASAGIGSVGSSHSNERPPDPASVANQRSQELRAKADYDAARRQELLIRMREHEADRKLIKAIGKSKTMSPQEKIEALQQLQLQIEAKITAPLGPAW